MSCKTGAIGMPEAAASRENIPGAVSIIQKKYHRKIRIAVANMKRLENGPDSWTSLITDETIRQLSGIPRIILLERSRFRDILSQLSLDRSGIVRSKDIRRLGRILPADVIVVGGYVLEDPKTILVQGRFIDLTTALVLSSFSYRLKLGGTSQEKENPEQNVTKCAIIQTPIRRALTDIRSKKRLDSLLQKALVLPFDLECGMIHFDIIRTFIRYDIDSPEYSKFLTATLATLNDPSDDNRAAAILKFLPNEGLLDSAEWAAARHALKNATRRKIYRYLIRIFSGRLQTKSVNESRRDEIMQLAIAKSIGKPIALHPARILRFIIAALNYNQRRLKDRRDFSDPLNAFVRYSRILYGNHHQSRIVFKRLHYAYLYHKMKLPLRIRLRKEMVKYLNASPAQYSFDYPMWKWLSKIDMHIEGRRVNAKLNRKVLFSHIKILNRTLHKRICASMNRSRRKHIRSGRLSYVRKYGIRCAGIAGAASLGRKLLADKTSLKEKEIIMKILISMGIYSRPAEKAVRHFLGPAGYQRGARKVRRSAARLLAIMKTKNSVSIRLLVQAMGDDDPARSAAYQALITIGPGSLPELRRGLLSARDRVIRARCADIMGYFGRDARKYIKVLKRVARTDASRNVRRRAGYAIRKIKNDY